MPAPVAGVDGCWACSSCNNVNFASRDACNRCAMPKPMYDKTWPAMSKNGQGHGGPKRGPPVAGVDGNWECTACGNVNFATRDACNLCQSPKPQYPATVSGGQPTWEQPTQKRGRPVAGVDGNWACGSCGNVNFAHRDMCNRCNNPKELATWEQPPGGQPTWEQPMQKRGRPVAGVDGNWACGSCGNVNFAHRDMCNRCNNPKELATWEQPPGGQQTWEQPMQKRGPPVAGVDGNWACGSCGNVNFAHRTSCNRCGMFKPEERRGGRPVAGVNGNWGCVNCGNVNFPARNQCNLCSAPKPQEWAPGGKGMGRSRPMLGVDGNWLCPACHNVNYGKRMSCNRCGLAKQSDKRKAPVAGENGNWLCPACGNVNFPHRSDCNRCAAQKPPLDAGEDNEGNMGKMGKMDNSGIEEGAPAKKIRTS